MKGHVSGGRFVGDIAQDEEQDNVATEDKRIEVVK